MSRISHSKIEWTHIFGERNGYSSNEVVGCMNNCTVETKGFDCYARQYWETRGKSHYPEMKSFEDVQLIQNNYNKSYPKKRSMIFVNALSDICYWNFDRVGKVFSKIAKYPQHVFVLLTKHPWVYQQIANHMDIPMNIWLGATCLNAEDVLSNQDKLYGFEDHITFLSIEPIKEEFNCQHLDLNAIKWLIIGGQTGPGEKFYPSQEWLSEVYAFTVRNDIPLFLKDNLKVKVNDVVRSMKEMPEMIVREWPEVI